VKFYTKIEGKHAYKFCMKIFIRVNDYKHGDCAKLCVTSGKYNVTGVCVSRKYAQKLSTKFYNY
jgi:hypothetical protein